MKTFTITLTYTFIGSYYEARRDYEKSGYQARGLSFLDWCEASLDKAVNRPYQSPPDDVEEILTDDYLNSLGFVNEHVTGSGYGKTHHHYMRQGNGRRERLMFTVYDGALSVCIEHRYGDAFPTTQFSGKIDSRQTFEIILNAVS